MNRENIIRMAREALIFPAQEKNDNGTGMWATFTVYKGSVEALEKFAALVAAAEREECAKVAEEATASWTQHVYNDACMHIAAAIRGRK